MRRSLFIRSVPPSSADRPLATTVRSKIPPLVLWTIAGLGFGVVACAYWPGVMIDDARWQYQQAVDNAYEDWHPPLMAWTWR